MPSASPEGPVPGSFLFVAVKGRNVVLSFELFFPNIRKNNIWWTRLVRQRLFDAFLCGMLLLLLLLFAAASVSPEKIVVRGVRVSADERGGEVEGWLKITKIRRIYFVR